jgi:hypothetical protein
MEFFKVKNWERFQHYRKRNPPWIKLYTSLLDDYEFSRLQDASKLLALCILMLAAKCHNKLPADPDWLHQKLGLQQIPDLEPLFEHGFIVKLDASNKLAECKQSAMPETETDRGEERRKRSEKEPDLRTSVANITERMKA